MELTIVNKFGRKQLGEYLKRGAPEDKQERRTFQLSGHEIDELLKALTDRDIACLKTEDDLVDLLMSI